MSGCWLWTACLDDKGYGRIGLGGKYGRPVQAQRASWMIHRGEVPSGLAVCHRCDVPACVNPAHLFLGTQSENHADMVAKNRHAKGDRARPKNPARGSQLPGAKLTEQSVAEIRDAAKRDVRASTLALQHGVSVENVRLIVAGRTWRHVP
jgi:hypothetical protein